MSIAHSIPFISILLTPIPFLLISQVNNRVEDGHPRFFLSGLKSILITKRPSSQRKSKLSLRSQLLPVLVEQDREGYHGNTQESQQTRRPIHAEVLVHIRRK